MRERRSNRERRARRHEMVTVPDEQVAEEQELVEPADEEIEEEDFQAGDDEEQELEEGGPDPDVVVPVSNRRERRADRVAAVATVQEVAEVQADGSGNGNAVLYFIEQMRNGERIVVTRKTDNVWEFSEMGAAVENMTYAIKNRLPGDYWQKVLSKEFQDHDSKWKELTYEEKVAWAEDHGVEWERHDDVRTDTMRLTAAVRENLGIEKYKSQYRTRQLRSEAKRKAMLGMEY